MVGGPSNLHAETSSRSRNPAVCLKLGRRAGSIEPVRLCIKHTFHTNWLICGCILIKPLSSDTLDHWVFSYM